MNHNPYSPPRSTVSDAAQSEANTTRPPAVTWAAGLLWAGLAATFVNLLLLVWRGRSEVGLPHLLIIAIIFAVIAGLTTWIALKIRAGRNWARIVLLVVDLISLPFAYGKLGTAFSMSLLVGVTTTSIYVLDYLAAVLLFIGSSNLWFKKQKAHRKSVA